MEVIATPTQLQQILGPNLVRTAKLDVAKLYLPKISIDSRKIMPGQWFLAIKGAHKDGHDFIEEALENGALGYIAEHPIAADKHPHIRVKSSLKAYHSFAARWRNNFLTTPVIAITGSAGKTTAKEMTALMLSKFGKVHASFLNNNNELGVPKTILGLNSSHDFLVLEFGARHRNDIEVLTEICQPDISVCLNVYSNHLEMFKNQDAIYKAKTDILRSKSLKKAITCADDDKLLNKAQEICGNKVVTFGHNPISDILVAKDARDYASFRVANSSYQIHSQFLHSCAAINFAAALAIAKALDLDLSVCARALEDFNGIKGRYLVHRFGGNIVIDDSYNASPESMQEGIVSCMRHPGKKILFLGDMLELGDKSEEKHLHIAETCLRHQPDKVITVGSKSEIIHRAISNTIDAKHFTSADAANIFAKELQEKNSVTYIKASNSIGLEKIVTTLISKYSGEDVAV